MVVAAVLFALAALLTRQTALGLLIESVGVNPEASRQAGLRSRGLLLTVYTFRALCAAIAGLILTSNHTAADANNTGLFIELDAILAVVIGGTSIFGGEGSIFGTVVGLFIPAVLLSGFTILGVTPYWQTVAVGSVLIAAVYIDQSRRAAASRVRGRWVRIVSISCRPTGRTGFRLVIGS